LSWLNPELEKKALWGFWGNFGPFEKLELSRLNPNFSKKKIGLSRLSPNSREKKLG